MRIRRQGELATFAILGDPVAHSASPAMQSAAMRALGLPAVYVALRPHASGVAEVMRALIRTGGGGNVTLPFKREAAAAADIRTARVERLGVANTFWGEDGTLHADNTDVDGVLESLAGLGVDDGGSWLLIGTGGSARSVAAAAVERGASLVIRSRETARAQEFGAWLASIGGTVATDASACSVAINATPLGMKPGDALPADVRLLPKLQAALDLVYVTGGTAWVHAARDAGLHATDGRTMLLGQGVAAFRRWFPTRKPPTEIMRATLREALGGWI